MDTELTGGAPPQAQTSVPPPVAPSVVATLEAPASHRRKPRVGGTRAELRMQRRRRLRRFQTVFVLGLLVMMVSVRALMLQAFSIPSESMEPTLEVGDRVLVNKLSYDVGEVARGQVIVFDGAGSFVPAEDRGFIDGLLGAIGFAVGEDDYIKRVIGVPGDRVQCCDLAGRLQVNGIPIDEPYIFGHDLPSRNAFDIRVPPGRLWVMGDHRSRSQDSRAHLGDPGGGTVSVDKVVGRAVAIVWPPSRVGWLSIPDSFERLATEEPMKGRAWR